MSGRPLLQPGRPGDSVAKERHQRWLRFGRRAVLITLVFYLGYRILQVGVAELLASLPTSPLFYIIAVCLYLALPVSDAIGYRLIFHHLPLWRAFAAFLRKRVYNKDVVGYSGEIYLFLWFKRALGIDEKQAFHAVKDYNLVSSICATTWAITVLAAIVLTGSIEVIADYVAHPRYYLLGGTVAVAVAAFLLYQFRRRLLGTPIRRIAGIAVVHVARLALVSVLRVVQWMVVLPGTPLATWLTLLAAEIVLTRLPFLPSKDLLFAGAAFTLAPLLDLPTAPLIAMLVTAGFLERFLNLLVFIGPPAAGLVRRAGRKHPASVEPIASASTEP